jgi:hypothetical protein
MVVSCKFMAMGARGANERVESVDRGFLTKMPNSVPGSIQSHNGFQLRRYFMCVELTRAYSVICCGLLIGICQSTKVFALDPGYIEAVEADVAEFTTKEFHPPANSSWLGSVNSESQPLMDLDGFSDYLKEKSPGSFIFYKKLPNEYKERLHQDYLATGDLDRIKQDIFKYTREMKK